MTASAGVVKWFGGHNKAKDAENKFGFIEGASGTDVFLHQSQWLGDDKPAKSQLVYFELEEHKGKWSAKNAKALADTPYDKLIELLEIIADGPKTSVSETISKFIESQISVELRDPAGPDAEMLIERLGLQKLLSLLLWKSDWFQNVEYLERKGLIKPLRDIEWSLLPTPYITGRAEQMADYLQSLEPAEAKRLAQTALERFPQELRIFCLLAGLIKDEDADNYFSDSNQYSLDSFVRKIYSQSGKVPEYLTKYIKKKALSSGGITKDPDFGPTFSRYQFKKFLYEKNFRFISLYDTTKHLQSRFDFFVLKEIFSLILAGNPLDTVYRLFLGRLWEEVSSGKLDPTRQAEEILSLFPACGTITPSLSCEAVYWDKKNMFLCRGRECNRPKVIGHPEQKNYFDFNIYDWFSHFGVNYLTEQEPTSRDFPIKLAGFLNRLREIFEALHCRKCESLMLPDLKYARIEYTDIENGKPVKKDMAPAYRLTVFKCPNHKCPEHQRGHYISHCMGYDCYDIIDSRESSMQCDSGRYICRNCASCCGEHAKSNPAGFCPDCTSPLRIYESRTYDSLRNRYNRYVKCSNALCSFSIRSDDLTKRFYLPSCGPVISKDAPELNSEEYSPAY